VLLLFVTFLSGITSIRAQVKADAGRTILVDLGSSKRDVPLGIEDTESLSCQWDAESFKDFVNFSYFKSNSEWVLRLLPEKSTSEVKSMKCTTGAETVSIRVSKVEMGTDIQTPQPLSVMRPVVITADQPNVWTLDQAHYLLAQMHRRNLDLKATQLTDLDANDINATRLDALRTLLDVSAEYDESVGLKNRTLRGEKEYNTGRKKELTAQKDQLNTELVELTRQIADLKIQRIRSDNEDEQTELDEQIKELEIVKAVVKEQIDQKNSELATLTTIPDYQSVSPERASTTNKQSAAYDSALTDAVKEVTSQFAGTPQLNASLRLDNYLQMQYEILSKQLTLLRDEVGAGERLIFLEMPQSINTSYDKADNKWAQSWWKIAGYAQCIAYRDSDTVLPCSKVFRKSDSLIQDQNFSTSEVVSNLAQTDDLLRLYEERLTLTRDDVDFNIMQLVGGLPSSNPLTSVSLTEFNQKDQAFNACLNANNPENRTSNCKKSSDELNQAQENVYRDIVADLNKFINSSDALNSLPKLSPRMSLLRNQIPITSKLFRRALLHDMLQIPMPVSFVQDIKEIGNIPLGSKFGEASDRSVRVVDMFPKQSSLNVNELKMESNALSFKFLFKLLAGFGANANYERNREKYSQFVQQELYSSAFGKGSTEFGWTFNPMPGTKRVSSGTKTTFAILIVPEDATAVILKSRGAYFSRSSMQPQSFDDTKWLQGHAEDKRGWGPLSRIFVVPIPDGGSMNNNAFNVNGVAYKPVEKGKRITVTIDGEKFSSQTGILVDGVPLTQSLGLGQPFIRDDSKAADLVKSDIPKNEVDGSFERVGSTQLVASFRMNEKYEGTPTITLIAPGRAIVLNEIASQQIKISIKGKLRNTNGQNTLENEEYMFGIRPDDEVPKIQTVKVFTAASDKGFIAVITGENLNTVSQINLNGSCYRKVETDGNADNPKNNIEKDDCKANAFGSRDGIIKLSFAPVEEKMIQIFLVYPKEKVEKIVEAPPIENPNAKKEDKQLSEPKEDFALMKIDSAEVVGYKTKPNSFVALAVVELKGLGFKNKKIKLEQGGNLQVVSDTHAIFTVEQAELPMAIKIISTDDPKNPIQALFVVKDKERPKSFQRLIRNGPK